MTRAAAPRPRAALPARRSAPHATLCRAPEGDRPAGGPEFWSQEETEVPAILTWPNCD